MSKISQEKKEIMRKYYPQNFNKLSEEEKKDLYEKTVEMAKKELGLIRPYYVTIENKTNQDYCAYYDSSFDGKYGNVVLGVDLVKLKDTTIIFEAIMHEMKHAEQDEIAFEIKEEPNEKRKALCKIQCERSQCDRDEFVEIKGIDYHGEHIEDIIGRSALYINLNGESRLTAFDKSDEALLLYKFQPIEREAYEYEFENNTQLFKQMQHDLSITPTVATNRHIYIKDTIQHKEEIKRLFPDSKNIFSDIDNTLLNIYNQKNGIDTVYEISSKELEWAVKWNMMSTAHKYNSEIGTEIYTDPRTIIDQKNMMRQRSTLMRNPENFEKYQGNQHLVENAQKAINGKMIENSYGKKIDEMVAKATQERKNLYLQDENLETIVRYFNPTIYESLDKNTKKALIGACINKMSTDLGLTQNYLPQFISSKGNYKPYGNYLTNRMIKVDINANPFNIVRSIGYNMHKAFQNELLQGKTKEQYNGQTMLYIMQNQSPKAVSTKDRYEPGDMYIVEPKSKENFLGMIYDTSENLYGMFRVQPIERDASKYSDKYADVLRNRIELDWNKINEETGKVIREYNYTRYEYVAWKYVPQDKNLEYLENEINAVMVNMYAESAGKPQPFNIHEKDLEEIFRTAQLDSYTYRTENQIFVSSETIDRQQREINQRTTSFQQKQNGYIKARDTDINDTFSEEDFNMCVENIPNESATQDNEIIEITPQEIEEDDPSL